MPAGGDNKPKLEEAINKAVATIVRVDDKCGSLCVGIATMVFIGSFVLGCFFAMQPHVSFIILIPDLILFVSSIYYLSRKI